MDDIQKPKRARRADVMLARQAAAVVKQMKTRIGSWQQAAAFVRARLTYYVSGPSRAQAALEARQMLEDIEAAREDLNRRSDTLPVAVRQHSRFQDAAIALDSLARLLDAALQGTAMGRRQPHVAVDKPDSLDIAVVCSHCGAANHLVIQGQTSRAARHILCSMCRSPIVPG